MKGLHTGGQGQSEEEPLGAVVLLARLHVGVLRCQSRDGDLIEEELPLVRSNGRVQLVHGLTPVVLLTQLVQNL